MKIRLLAPCVAKAAFYPAVLLAAVFLALPVQSAYSQKSTCDFQHKECFTEQGYPACYNKIDIQKYYEFTDKGETALAEQLISDYKRCVTLKGNEKAFMTDKSAGYVKFGIRGQDKTYWAKREALFAR